MNFRFPKTLRIKSSEEFTIVLKKGAHAADEFLVVNAKISPRPTGRLGVTIPKKTGNAVVRNQWKRCIREAFRLEQHELPAGFDFVVKPRRGAAPDFHAIRRSLVRLSARATRTRRTQNDR